MSRVRFLADHDVNTMPAAAFHRIKLGQPLAGLLMVNQTEPSGSIIKSLLLIWRAGELEEWKDQVVFLPIR